MNKCLIKAVLRTSLALYFKTQNLQFYMEHLVKILEKKWLSHNVMSVILDKPKDYTFTIGQAIELTIVTEGLRVGSAPFTLTSLPNWPNLELMIKIYPEHQGVTWALSKHEVYDRVGITNAWDSYEYNGPGVFIAGGSGITPFIPMIRDLNIKKGLNNHKLIHANRNSKDVIMAKELKNALGGHYLNILSRERCPGHNFGRIDGNYLKQQIDDFDQNFYLCGPDAFSERIQGSLIRLGAKKEKIQIGY